MACLAPTGRREDADAAQSLDLADEKAHEARKLEPKNRYAKVALGDVSSRRAQLDVPDQARSHLQGPADSTKLS